MCVLLLDETEHHKNYFLNYRVINSDFTVDLNNGNFMTHQNINLDWKVTLVDTGLNSMTGGRVKRMKNFVGNETFLLTYGDGLTDINISDLISITNWLAVEIKSHHLC